MSMLDAFYAAILASTVIAVAAMAFASYLGEREARALHAMVERVALAQRAARVTGRKTERDLTGVSLNGRFGQR